MTIIFVIASFLIGFAVAILWISWLHDDIMLGMICRYNKRKGNDLLFVSDGQIYQTILNVKVEDK